MPRARSNPEQRLDSYLLWKEHGNRPAAIERALHELYEDETVSIRTINTWLKDFKERDTALDDPFRWHMLEDYQERGWGLPWEASEFLLSMWSWNAKRLVATDIRERRLPSIREVRWWWRIHLASPGEHMTSVLYEALAFAQNERFCMLEGLSFKDDEGTQGLWQHMALRDDESYGDLKFTYEEVANELGLPARRINHLDSTGQPIHIGGQPRTRTLRQGRKQEDSHE